MNLPSLPTDNLYKFQALSGTVLIVLSFYLPSQFAERLSEKYESITLKIATLSADSNFKKRKVEKLTRIIDNTIAAQNNKNVADKNKIELHYSETEIKKLFDEVDDLSRSIDIQLAESKQIAENLKYIEKRIFLTRLLMVVFGCIGTALAFIGYYLWYHKIQFYLDIVAKGEACKVCTKNKSQQSK
jgi:hypothetical protein